MDFDVLFRILGPLEVVVDDRQVAVRAGKHRALLASLLLRANQVVSVEDLIDRIWDDTPPAKARATLQTYVMRLRQRLGTPTGASGLIHTRPEGYLLQLDPAGLDLHEFRELVRRGRHRAAGSDLAGESASLHRALALWRGPALADVPSAALARDEVPRLAEERLQVLERRIEVDLQLGQHGELVSELRRLTADHPLRERFWHQLMLALYRAGRQADALEAYRTVSAVLAGQLGIDPGEQLRGLHQSILEGDRELATAPRQQRPAPVATGRRWTPVHQLPPDLGDFVGREDQLRQISEQLSGGQARGAAPIVVLAGPPGIGKTALAVRAAHQLGERFPDGQLHANLRGYATGPPTLVGETLVHFLRVLGVPRKEVPAENEDRAALYRSLLTGRRVLVVLDNAAAADQVRPLLPAEPGCAVLVTSRDDLRGLTALQGARRLTLDVLERPEALALLSAIVGADRVIAEPAAATGLAELCARLPLALRIAAANLVSKPLHSLASYREELHAGNRLAALSVVDDDQAAVHAAFDLSYTAMKPEARRLFRHLGLVPGPDFTAPVAAALLDATTAAAERLLDRLAAANLVGHHSPGRYQFHDLLRLYATECGAAEDSVPDRAAARQRLFDFYLHTSDNATTVLHPEALRLTRAATSHPPQALEFKDNTEAFGWLERERPNLVAAIEHAADHGPQATAWHLTDALGLYFRSHRHNAEWLTTGSAALRAATLHGDLEARAAMHHSLGTAHWNSGDYPQAVDHFREAIAIRADSGPAEAAARTLNNLGIVYSELGQLQESQALLLQAIELHRAAGDTASAHSSTANLGIVCCSLGHYERGIEQLRTALDWFRQAGLAYNEGNALESLAKAYLDLGDHPRAQEYAEAALRLAGEVGDRRTEADALCVRAALYLEAAAAAESLRCCAKALEISRKIHYHGTEIDALIVLAGAHRELGRLTEAVDHGQQALAVASRAGLRIQEGRALSALARIHLESGDDVQALHYAEQSLAAHRETGHLLGEARALTLVGRGLERAGDLDQAERSWREATELFTLMGTAVG